MRDLSLTEEELEMLHAYLQPYDDRDFSSYENERILYSILTKCSALL